MEFGAPVDGSRQELEPDPGAAGVALSLTA